MSKAQFPDLEELSIPGRIKKIGEGLQKDVALLFNGLNIKFDPKWFALCKLLADSGSAPINEISTLLGLTHPAIVQLVNELEKNNIVESSKDVDDKRKRIVTLTAKGKDILKSALPLIEVIDESVIELCKSSGYDIIHFLCSAEKIFGENSLVKLAADKYKKRLLDQVEILRYSPQYKKHFKDLNYEWLNKYFKVEELDEKILSNPEE